MKRIIFAVIFLVFTVFSTTAFAANSTYNWTGFYIGLQGFYGNGGGDNHDYDDDDYYSYSGTDWKYASGILRGYHGDHDIDGWMGGAFAGYNYQFPFNLVVGVETDINGGEISGSGHNGPNPDWSENTDISWVGSTRFRLGYAIYRFLPYIAVGVAYGEANIYTEHEGIEYGEKNIYFGLTPALGLEFAITKNLFTRLEYSYYAFGKERSEVDNGYLVDTKINFHSFKFGLSWKF